MVSSKSCLPETPRHFSSNPSSNSEQFESLGSKPIGNDKDIVSVGAVSSESDEGSSIFYGIEDNFASENGSDFVYNKFVMEDDENAEEVRKCCLYCSVCRL